MQTKQFKHKRKGGSYRIHAIAKGSGSLNTSGDDSFVVYHNELGQHFVRPLVEFSEVMDEVKKPLETEAWQGNWPAAAEARMTPVLQNGNTGEHYGKIKQEQDC